MHLRELLEKYRARSVFEREEVTYFDRLVKAWLEYALTQNAQFIRVRMFSDWAAENRFDQRDNGKSTLEWVMERRCVKADPASCIINDADRYAIETVSDPAYPFKLFCRIIIVSLEMMKIMRGLPGLDVREGKPV